MFLSLAGNRFHIVYFKLSQSLNSSKVWIVPFPIVLVPKRLAPAYSCKAAAIISPALAVIQSIKTTVFIHSNSPNHLE